MIKDGKYITLNDWRDINHIKESHQYRIGYYRFNTMLSPDEYDKMIRDGCQICKQKFDFLLDVHHKDKNKLNNKQENLLYICPNCHAKIHRADISEIIKERGNHI